MNSGAPSHRRGLRRTPSSSGTGECRTPRRDWSHLLPSSLLGLALAAFLVLTAACAAIDASAPATQPASAEQPLSTQPPPTATPAFAAATAILAPPPATAPTSPLPSPAASLQPTPLPTRPATPTSTAGPTASPTVVPPNFSGQDAWQHVSRLADDVGSRPNSTEATRRAAEYVLARLTAMGYQARLEPYTFAHFQERSTRLLQREPEEREIAARAFVYTGRGAVEAPLADCGLGQPSDFPESGLGGKVALIQRGGGITFQEKVSSALRAGAGGVLIINDRTGDFRGSLSEQASVPVAGISQANGRLLQGRLRQGPVVVGLEVDASSESRQGNNVVAGPSAASAGKKLVVIGAHYDSVAAGPGANDNASGVGVLLELADALRARNYPFELVFVAFGDEEVGLIGSRRYVEALSAEQRERIAAMINLDMVGVGEQMEIGGDQELERRVLRIAQQSGYPASELAARSGASSDHASFQEFGIPAVLIHRTEDSNYHTAQDRAEKVLPEHLEAAGKLVLRLLDDLSRSS